MVRATGLFHATLPVWDLARAERFWFTLLGITRHATPSYFPTSVVFLDLGNTMIHLVRYGDAIPRPHPRSTHLAIEVDVSVSPDNQSSRSGSLTASKSVWPETGGFCPRRTGAFLRKKQANVENYFDRLVHGLGEENAVDLIRLMELAFKTMTE